MGKIRIVTDSSIQFLDPAQIEQYDVTIVPVKIRFGDEVFREGIDLDEDAFFHLEVEQRLRYPQSILVMLVEHPLLRHHE